MTLFDRYLVVDWSASNSPKRGRDSIWVCDRSASGEVTVANPTTRRQGIEGIRRVLVEGVSRAERMLVAFDFPYAYPTGFAAALGLSEPAWSSIWAMLRAELQDNGRTNETNRFELADRLNLRLGSQPTFWGCPPNRPGLVHLTAK